MIEREEAIEIARKRALEKGWAFAEPVYVIERSGWRRGITQFEIETNAGKLGAKARFTVDAKSGEIVSEGYVPR